MDRKIKIAWVIDEFPSPYQNYIKNLYVNLSSKPEINIDIYSNKFNLKNFQHLNNLKKIKGKGIIEEIIKRIFRRGISKLESELLKYDIIHIQQSFLCTYVHNILSLKKRPKIVITFRGGDTYVKPWVNDKWREYHKMISQYFDAIQVMSNNQAEYLKKWGHTTDKTWVIPISIGIPNVNFHLNKINQEIIISSVFRMTWEKNIESNVRLIWLLKEKKLNIQYHVYGNGPDIGQLYYLIDKFNINDIVKVHGKVTPEELNDELRKSHFLLQLSSSDALPASVIEALGIGIPCIVSDVGGFKEIIQSNHNGFVVDFINFEINKAADFIEYASLNNNFYQLLKENAFKTYLANFSPDIEAKKILTMYYNMLLL